MFGLNEAAKWAFEILAASGGKDLLKQQATGFLGMSYDDEVIMIRLIDALKGIKPAWQHTVMVNFIDELSPYQKTRLRHVLGTMLVPAPTKTKEMVAVLGPDGQPLQEKGKILLKEKVVETSVEYTDKDPRVLFLKHLAETLGKTPNDETRAAAKQVLLVTGAILDKAIIERLIALGGKAIDKLVVSKDAVRNALFAAYGVASYAEFTAKLEGENEAAERKLQVRKNQFWMEWLWPVEKIGWTLFVTVGGMTGLGLIALAFTAAPK